MSSIFSSVRDTLYSVTSCCFPNPTLYINRRTFKVIRLLGEGGFSFVYLVQDASTSRLFALKQIRCPFGGASVKDAMKEVEMYRLFQHDNIIKVIDSCVVPDKDSSKIVYIFLPYYKNGNLQDAINKNSLEGKNFAEKDMLKIFQGICCAVRVLHNYKLPSVQKKEYEHTNGNALPNGHIDNDVLNQTAPTEPQVEEDIVPFAHRDIKPGNILMSDDMQTPVLMDFGSLIRARIKVDNRSNALEQQELAAEKSTISYRAPELFDVKTNVELNEKVDIWSLGCTLYAMAYGKSPFENNLNEQGGSIALAVLNNQYKLPSIESDIYSQEFRNLISFLLAVDPKDRPSIHQVIERVDSLIEQLDPRNNDTNI
ncbi:13617_t:CDS:2 [Dentiscutata erythropus]|uniref:non-specific serine/threonine protein kinase n=1 Tax=Dentiscutata erythropus TaxID=1348616 RepID=A0A9N9G3W4_9GLOM|nr:13617_t:CDS:2 [Dentiscutata erythropus]